MAVKHGYRKFAPQVVAVFILPTSRDREGLSRITVLAQPSGPLYGAIEERGIPQDQKGPGSDLTSLPSRIARYLLNGGEAPHVEMLRSAYNRAVTQMKHESRYRNWTLMGCFELAMQEALQAKATKQ